MPATGQLWYGTQGGGDNARVVRATYHIDDNSADQAIIVDNNPQAFPTGDGLIDIGLDTALGFYFGISNGGATGAQLVRGSTNGGAPVTVFDFAGEDPNDDAVVRAFYVDTVNRRIFVGVSDINTNGTTDANETGVRVFNYDANGNVSGGSFLFTAATASRTADDNPGRVDALDFAYDPTTNRLYFSENNTVAATRATGLFYVNVANPTAIIPVVTEAQFPDTYSGTYFANGAIRDVEVDSQRGHIFFTTRSLQGQGGTSYVAAQNRLYVIDSNAAPGTNATIVTLTGAPADFHPEDMAFDQRNNILYIEHRGTQNSDDDDVILVFQLSADGRSATLVTTIFPAANTSTTFSILGMDFNELPTLTATGAGTINEGAPPSSIFQGTALVADAEGYLTGATITLSGNREASDVLSITGSGPITASSYNPATGVITLSGVATQAQYQTVINSLRYQTTSENPTGGSRTVTIVLNDGSNAPAGSQNTSTTTFNVQALNDAPVIGNLNGDVVNATANYAGYLVDAGSNATVADLDSANFDGGTLTVTLTNGQGGEYMSAVQVGGITTTDTTVSFNGVQFATYTGSNTASQTYTFDPDATPAAVQALLRAIIFGSSTGVGAGARTITYTLNDGDGIANGGVSSTTVTSTVNVSVPNTPPTGTDNTLTTVEDTRLVLTLADFGTADSDGTVDAVRISTLPGNGTLYIDTDGAGGGLGTAVTAGQVVTVAQINAGNLVFVPTLNTNATGTFTFAARDNGGAFDASPNTITLNITPVNDAPTSTGFDNVTFTEGQSYVQLDTGFNQVLTDIDSANFDGGTLTVQVSANLAAAEDAFILLTGGTSFLSISAANRTVSYNNVVIATFQDASDGDPGESFIFTFNANATVQAVQTVMRNLAYTNVNQANPSTATRTIAYTLTDGDGGTLNLTSTVNVVAVNDAPSGTDFSTSTAGDQRLVLQVADFGFSDVDGNSFDAVILTTVPSSGTLYYDSDGAGGSLGQALVAGNVVQASQIAAGQLVFVPVDATATVSFTFQVRDNGANGNGNVNIDTSPNTFTINVTQSDVPPTAVTDTPTTAENAVLTGNLLNNDTDPDGGPKTVASVNGVPANVGTQITLASGALLTVNADGTYSYDPNGAFDDLTGVQGATNYSRDDVFSYELNGGSTTSVIVTVTGVSQTGQIATGSGSDDTLVGTPQPDRIDASQGGNDTVNAGASNDVIYFGTAFDAGDTLDGGAGRDILALQGTQTRTFGATQLTSVEVLALMGSADNSFGGAGGGPFNYSITTNDGNVAAGTTMTIEGRGLAAGEFLSFNGSAETDGAFAIFGGGGSDTLMGGAGNDTLNGGGGTDVLQGGAGNDTYFVDGPDLVIESAGQGFDSVYATGSYMLAGGTSVELLATTNSASTTGVTLMGNTFSQKIVGTAGADFLYGNGGDDQLVGGAGNDTLYGQSGRTVLDGGTGNDVYYVTDNQQALLERVGEGFDTVNASGSFALYGDVEVEVLNYVGGGAGSLYGNGFAQTLNGAGGNDLLSGGGGNDVLNGGAGNDQLIGGAGADTMTGGTGDDVYYVDQGGDQVIELGGQGFDQVYATASFALSANASIELLATGAVQGTAAIDLTGSNTTQSIYGNNGQNVLSGLGGDDFLYGMGGDDILDGGAGVDVLSGGSGNDVFRYTATSDSTLAGYDRIVDFATGDRFDLTAIDANTTNGASGDQFTFIGSSAFSGTAGELRAVFDGSKWAIQGDTDGDGVADLAIVVYTTDNHQFTAGDFLVPVP